MVVYILIVGVLNLGLGFAVAWHLGRRYRELLILAVESAVPTGTTVAWGEPLAESAGEEDLPTTCSTDPDSDQEDLADVEGPPDAGPHSDTPLSAGEASAAHLRSEVQQYHQQLIHLDNALRDCTLAPDADTVRSCVDSLRETNTDYRTTREKIHQTFQEDHQEQAFQSINDELLAIIARQDAQIDETDGVIRNLDCQADPEQGCRQVVQETSKLLEVNHNLRDKLGQVPVVAARNEGRLKSIDRSKLTDPLTELSSRAALEACLADWWEKDPHRVRQLNAAMIDIDELGRMNERHGQEMGDRVLRAVSRILTTESRNHLIAARYSGQQFMLLFPDVDLRFATNLVERIRQTIELTQLTYHGEEIRVTVSCAVTEIGREDTSDTMYARAEATLYEAKRYGRNRTFRYEGKYPNPVVPPNFALQEKSVAL